MKTFSVSLALMASVGLVGAVSESKCAVCHFSDPSHHDTSDRQTDRQETNEPRTCASTT